MEHRWSRRLRLQGNVTLSMAGGKSQALLLSDLSLGGIGLMTPRVPLPVNGFVTVSFTLDQDDDTTHHRILAQVVHSRSTLAGLMFIDPEQETMRCLRTVLNEPGGEKARIHPVEFWPDRPMLGGVGLASSG
jgi:hypothetical protein